MPYAPLRPCAFPGGCAERVPKGMCEAHKKQFAQDYDKSRGNSHRRGYDRNGPWAKVRLRALKRDKYICQHCLQEGRIIPAEHVDHIVPFHGKDDPLRLDLDNLQSLCQPCHSRKTATEDGGFGRTLKASG